MHRSGSGRFSVYSMYWIYRDDHIVTAKPICTTLTIGQRVESPIYTAHRSLHTFVWRNNTFWSAHHGILDHNVYCSSFANPAYHCHNIHRSCRVTMYQVTDVYCPLTVTRADTPICIAEWLARYLKPNISYHIFYCPRCENITWLVSSCDRVLSWINRFNASYIATRSMKRANSIFLP